jgi:hypothetical protein
VTFWKLHQASNQGHWTLAQCRSVIVHLAAVNVQGFPVRLAPGAPSAVRLLKGHPFTAAAAVEDGGGAGDEGQMSLTQLAPEQQLVPAQVVSGEQLQSFKVCQSSLRPDVLTHDNRARLICENQADVNIPHTVC